MDNFPDNTLLSFMISPLAVPYIFFIYLLTYVFNFPFLILLHSLVYKRSVHNENEGRLGRGGGGAQKMYYTEGSHAVSARPFGKNRPEERAMELEILR